MNIVKITHKSRNISFSHANAPAYTADTCAACTAALTTECAAPASFERAGIATVRREMIASHAENHGRNSYNTPIFVAGSRVTQVFHTGTQSWWDYNRGGITLILNIYDMSGDVLVATD